MKPSLSANDGTNDRTNDAMPRLGSGGTLVVAAWEPELERFRALGQARGHNAVVAATEVFPVGIGLVDATVGTAARLGRGAPDLVLFVGTCGAAPSSGLAIGDVIVGRSVRLVDAATIEGRAALPFSADAIPLDADVLAAAMAAGAREATIANTLGITTDDALAATLSPHGQVEHLEAYGVARACQVASVRCAVILGVTNIVGSRGREEWRANHVATSARAGEVAWQALGTLRTSTTRRSPG